MKRTSIFLLLIFLGTGMVSGQYKINKTRYDYKTWSYQEGDPYNPTTCGVLSFIPGLGQMAANEFGRGAAFLGGALGCIGVSFGGFALAWTASEVGGVIIMAIGVGGFIAIDIWSIVDATRVAKVNNLSWRDQNSSGFNLRLEPYISPVQSFGSTKTQVGLSMKLRF